MMLERVGLKSYKFLIFVLPNLKVPAIIMVKPNEVINNILTFGVLMFSVFTPLLLKLFLAAVFGLCPQI